jgi:hypothetical protein
MQHKRDKESISDLKKELKKLRDSLKLNELKADPSNLVKTYTSNGVLFSASENYKKQLNSNYDLLKNKLKSIENELQHKSNGIIVNANTSYYISNENANLGWSLSAGDLNKDESEDLVIGAPVYSYSNSYQDGAVFVVMSISSGGLPYVNMNLENSANLIIFPPNNTQKSRFGHQVILLDINQDGFLDYVISAPSYGLEDIKYEGRVYIYFGGASLDVRNPSVTITCEKYRYCNLGWNLAKGDVNRMLLILI